MGIYTRLLRCHQCGRNYFTDRERRSLTCSRDCRLALLRRIGAHGMRELKELPPRQLRRHDADR